VRTLMLCFVKLLIIPYQLNDKSLGRIWSYYEYTLIICPLEFRGYCTYHQVIIISLNSIKRSVFVMKSLCVYCEVQTEFLCMRHIPSRAQSLNQTITDSSLTGRI